VGVVDAPPGLTELEAVIAARPATPELMLLPRDFMAALIAYVRWLETDEFGIAGIGGGRG
jgi:hypothetical protein